MEKKQKRFYKVGEIVWVVRHKQEGTVISINKEELTMTVLLSDETDTAKTLVNGKMWDFDKLKYQAKEKKEIENSPNSEELKNALLMFKQILNPEIFFAKVRPTATIPSKRKEDAGYDIYADLSHLAWSSEDREVLEIECPVFATTLVPTGLAVAMPDTHYLNLKHERGSTGVQSMAVLAGVIDSGFRNEMFVAMTPLRKSVIITNQVQKVEETERHIFYPLSKAIVQGTIDLVPNATITELSLAELQAIPSERGMTMLGQSGK